MKLEPTEEAEKVARCCVDFERIMRDEERKFIRAALRAAEGNVSLAAKILMLKRTTLQEKIRRLGIVY